MESFMIKDATKKLGIEAHVLRYWEEELGLEIKRNSMGHRYYDEKDIKMFGEIKRLRAEGISLKEIRRSIDKAKEKGNNAGGKNKDEKNGEKRKPETADTCEAAGASETEGTYETEHNDKIVSEKNELKAELTADRADNIVDFKAAQLQTLMNKIVANAFRENKSMLTNAIKFEVTEDVMKQMDIIIREKEEREEERFRRLDESLRQIQRANEEVAATRSKRIFGRKRH